MGDLEHWNSSTVEEEVLTGKWGTFGCNNNASTTDPGTTTDPECAAVGIGDGTCIDEQEGQHYFK